MSDTNSCIDYADKFERWLTEDLSSIQKRLIGISFYSMELDENLFGHEFNLITSKPKNFRINTISTSRNDLNAIETYMLLIKKIKTNRFPQKKENKNYFVKHAYNNLHKNNRYDFYFKQNSQQSILTIRPAKEDLGIADVKHIITIVYIDKETQKSFLVSISPKKDLEDYNFKSLLGDIYNTFIYEDGSFIQLKNKFLSANVKPISDSFYNYSQMKTSLVFFSDITNSTQLINSYPREGLFIIRHLVGKLAEIIEKHDLLINEIPGDGLLYSIGFGKFLKQSFKNKRKSHFLENFLKTLYETYSQEKQKILQEFKDSCEYKNNPSFYTSFENLLEKAYLKTALCIDGIYFLPLDGISFKQSILYGTRLWNIPKAFMEFEEDKNKNDIILFNENIHTYFKTFSLKEIKNISILKNREKIPKSSVINIQTYPKKHSL